LKNSAIKKFSKKPFCKPEYMMVVPLETLLPNWHCVAGGFIFTDLKILNIEVDKL
jgi:hypothetical protein